MKKVIYIITSCIFLIISSFICFKKSFEYQKPEKINNAQVAIFLMKRYISRI